MYKDTLMAVDGSRVQIGKHESQQVTIVYLGEVDYLGRIAVISAS